MAAKSRARLRDPDREVVDLARARFKQAESADQEQRKRELADIAFYDGEQWDPVVKLARSGQGAGTAGLPPVPARPSYVINKLRDPVRQVLNQERQTDLGIEIVAADDFGGLPGGQGVDDTEIELREGLVRRIQRDSEAADARTWAFARAVICGRGYYLVTTKYLPGMTWDQEVCLERIYDQSAVRLDPAHEQPDGSDADWGFVAEFLSWEEYKAQYPDGPDPKRPNQITLASVSDFDTLVKDKPEWFTVDGETRAVMVVNYYFVELEGQDLAILADGQVLPLTDVPADQKASIVDTRREVTRQVKWAKLDGLNSFPLEQTDWPSPFLPIIKVLGDELQPFDAQRRVEGMVRPARDSQQGFNAMVSKWVEQVALTPVPPFQPAEGQIDGYEDWYKLANTRNLPYLPFKTRSLEGDVILTPPARTPMDTNIAPMAASVQMFDQAVKSTTGVPDPTLGNVDPSLRSGEAIKRVLAQADRGTSSYQDNLVRSIRHEGRVINSLLYPIYNRPGRLVKMVTGEQNDTQSVILHQPFLPSQGPNGRPQPLPMTPNQPLPPQAKLYRLTKDAHFNVSIKVSKSYDTRRTQEATTIGQILTADPSLMTVFGDLFFKYQDGPGSKELSERMKAVLIPAVQALLQGQQPLPPEVQAQMAGMQQQVQALQQAADKNLADLQKTQLQEQAETGRAALAAQVQVLVAEIKAQTERTAAELKQQMEGIRIALEANQEARLDFQADQHESRRRDQDRAHEVGMAALEHQHALEQAAALPRPVPESES